MDIIQRANSEGVTGFLHPCEAQKLQELATGRDVLEVGSFMGLSAWCMAQTAKSVYCVDTFIAATDGQRQTTDEDRAGLPSTTLEAFLKATERFSNVSYYQATSEEAAQVIVAQFDMIFIDAMHTYEDVKADILRWQPKLKKGGLWVFHDYHHQDFPGVSEAVDEVLGPIPLEDTEYSLAWKLA